MSQSNLFIALLATFFLSCSNSAKKDEIIRKELPIASVVADTLFTQFPGNLRVTSGHILLQTPFDKEGFLKVYDRKTGKEIAWIGKKGRGPGEWTTPDLGNIVNDKLVVFDLNESKYVLASEENQYEDISNPSLIKKIGVMANRLNLTADNRVIVADFIDETHPFKILAGDKSISFGKYPFDEKITNALDRFQGYIAIHPEKELMVYGTISNPYLSLYSIKDNANLLWENQFGIPDYTITNGELAWGKNQISGVEYICFTKDYIACLVADPERKEMKRQTVTRGRTIEMSLRSVYLFDYEGRLSYILDIPDLAIRLASDTRSNTIYLVTIDPDFSIIKYDLSEYGI